LTSVSSSLVREDSSAVPVLRFAHVNVRLDERSALADVSFEIHTGETLVLYGAAASGKTVLMKTAIGLIQPDEGHVYLFGRDITTLREEEIFPLRYSVGMLFQEGGLFDSLTVEENVAYPLVNRRDRTPPESEVQASVKEALDFVGLGAAEQEYPGALSGGMRRRVGIARAVAAKPRLLLHDSPTAGLDPITAYRIMTLVIQQRDMRNATSLVVTHRYQDGRLLAYYVYDPRAGKLRRAGNVLPHTRFIVLRDGEMKFLGTAAELESSEDPYVARFAGKRRPSSDRGPTLGDVVTAVR
jgi:phospholipid/cholesterol/gamma-HCH transport system ATP-binding protein